MKHLSGDTSCESKYECIVFNSCTTCNHETKSMIIGWLLRRGGQNFILGGGKEHIIISQTWFDSVSIELNDEKHRTAITNSLFVSKTSNKETWMASLFQCKATGLFPFSLYCTSWFKFKQTDLSSMQFMYM